MNETKSGLTQEQEDALLSEVRRHAQKIKTAGGILGSLEIASKAAMVGGACCIKHEPTPERAMAMLHKTRVEKAVSEIGQAAADAYNNDLLVFDIACSIVDEVEKFFVEEMGFLPFEKHFSGNADPTYLKIKINLAASYKALCEKVAEKEPKREPAATSA